MSTSVPESTSASTPPPAIHGSGMSRGLRETIESIAIALALAFLFKSFEAEAFVIPTGSMAPTLMGRHKDVLCPQCGFQYTASGSDEADRNGYDHHDPERQVVACTCPMCRFTMSTAPADDGKNPNPSYSGDRIWVSKVTYQFTDPRRFDVLVFRYPDEAETYYIKRLAGLPGETIKIQHGDLFVKGPEEQDFTIVRKSPEKLRAMAQLVHDNDYVSETLLKHNWPSRWQEWGLGNQTLWQISDDTRSFSIDGMHRGDAWLRYEHTVPSEENWFRELWPPQYEVYPQLITDFYAFNTRILRQDRGAEPQALGMHWVGDLMLDCELQVRSDQGIVLLDLVKGGRHFGCQIDVATGKATLSIDGVSSFAPSADTPIRGPGTYQMALANADRQLTLWVDGQPIEFEQATSYDDLGNDHPRSTPDDPGDLAPVGIGSRGVSLEVRHLKVLRDIYYIADKNVYAREPISDYPDRHFLMNLNRRELADFFASPATWVDERGRSVFDARKSETFTLGPDQFFVLGDNSPASSDARLWRDHYVERDLLIGKALLIYWPHPLRLMIPGTDIGLGIIPNVGEMGLIR